MTATIHRQDRECRGRITTARDSLQAYVAYQWGVRGSESVATIPPPPPTTTTGGASSSGTGSYPYTAKSSSQTPLQPITITSSHTTQARLSKPVTEIRLRTQSLSSLPHVDDVTYSAPSSASTESSGSPQILLTPVYDQPQGLHRNAVPLIHLPASSFPLSSERQVSQVSLSEPFQFRRPQQPQAQLLRSQDTFAPGVRGSEGYAMNTHQYSRSCDWSPEAAAGCHNYSIHTGNHAMPWYPENQEHTALMAKEHHLMIKSNPDPSSNPQPCPQQSQTCRPSQPQQLEHLHERTQLYTLQLPDQQQITQPPPHSSYIPSTGLTIAPAIATTSHPRIFFPSSSSTSSISLSPPSNTVHPPVLTTAPPSISPLREFRSQSRITLHHPRPSRRIPIISLSKLASAPTVESASFAPVLATATEITPASSSPTSITTNPSTLSTLSLSSSNSARLHNSSHNHHHHPRHHPYHHPSFPHQHHIHDPGKYRDDNMRSCRGPSSIRSPRSSSSQSPEDRMIPTASFNHEPKQTEGFLQCSCGCMETYNVVQV